MELLEKMFSGWWGSIVSGAVVVLIEYLIIKPIVERSASTPASPSVSVQTGKKSKNRINIDNSRTQIISIVRRESVGSTRSSSGTEPKGSDDSDIWLVFLGGFVAIITCAWLIARYAEIISNVMLGIALGSAVTALLLAVRYRASPVPLGRWVIATVAVAAALFAGRGLMIGADYKGTRLSDASSLVRDRGFSDGLKALQEKFPFEVMGFLTYQFIGVLMLLLVSVLVMTRVVGVVVAAAALDNPEPRRWHTRVVDWLYPSRPFLDIVLSALLVTLGLLMVSGFLFSKTQEIPTNPFPTSPTSVTSPSGKA